MSPASLVKALAREDMILQVMADVRPTKWHLAHTSRLFEALSEGALASRRGSTRGLPIATSTSRISAGGSPARFMDGCLPSGSTAESVRPLSWFEQAGFP